MKSPRHDMNSHELLPNRHNIFTPSNNDWHGSRDPYVYAYSAYYDSRKVFGKENVVAVIGVMSNDVKFSNISKTCRYCEGDICHEVYPKRQFFFGMHFYTSQRLLVTDFVFWCPVYSLSFIPESVDVVIADVTRVSIPVTIPHRPAEVQDLLVCVKALYVSNHTHRNSIDHRRLIEWFEMNRLLGIQHFAIYIQSVNKKINKLLYYYHKLGILSVYSQGDINGDDYVQPRSIGLNDCIYRYMYSYRYIVNIDTDEIILPHSADTLTHLIAQIQVSQPKTSIADLIFKRRAFNLKHGLKTYLAYEKNINYEFQNNIKDILSVDLCLRANSHKCMRHSPGSIKLFVDEKYGISNHYIIKNQTSVSSNATDDRIMHFAPELRRNVQKVLNEI